VLRSGHRSTVLARPAVCLAKSRVAQPVHIDLEHTVAFTLPESGITDLTDEALAALEFDAVTALRDLDITEDSPTESIEEAESVLEALSVVRAEMDVRAEKRSRVQAIRDALPTDEPEAEAAEPEPEAEVEEEVEAVVDEPEAESTETPAEDDTDAADVVAEAESILDEAAQEPEPVAASGDETPAQRAARNTPTPSVPKGATVNLTAAAGLDGFDAGASMTLDGLYQAIEEKAKAMPTGYQRNFSQTWPVAKIERDFNGLSTDNPEYVGRVEALLADAASPSRLGAPRNLTAAAGWASPSEQMYDLCPNDATSDGILSLPEVGVTRGGFKFTRETDFPTVLAASPGAILTEAEVIAESPAKAAYEIPTPAFVEARLDASYLWVKAGILQNVAYPEQVADVTAKAVLAKAFDVNTYVIGKISADIVANGFVDTVADEGTISSTLDALSILGVSFRQKWRLGLGTVLEVVMPVWTMEAVRADLARRTARPNGNVTDAEIMEWFTTRKLNPQFVYGLDDLDQSGGHVNTFPTEVDVFVYPAGTYVKGMSPVLTLGTFYDSTLLTTNEYSGLFVEEGLLVVRRCKEGAKITVPVSVSGATGAADLDVGFQATS